MPPSAQVFQNTKGKMVLTRATQMALRTRQRVLAQRYTAQLCALQNASHMTSTSTTLGRNVMMHSSTLAMGERSKRSWTPLVAAAAAGLMTIVASSCEPSHAESPPDKDEKVLSSIYESAY